MLSRKHNKKFIYKKSFECPLEEIEQDEERRLMITIKDLHTLCLTLIFTRYFI